MIYYRPRRGSVNSSLRSASSYFAVARLDGITSDTTDSSLFYAQVTDYLEFDDSVSFRREEGSYELNLLKPDGSINKGAFGRSVRLLSDSEFETILHAGFASGRRQWESVKEYADVDYLERPIIESISKRSFRDRRFRFTVCDAYKNTCAITGLALINGGGRPEVQAAHIQPVDHRGPDSVRNGLALSGTAHWIFDRGLITLDDNFCIVPSGLLETEMHKGLIVPGKKISLPDSSDQRPSNHFLSYHRDHIFHE